MAHVANKALFVLDADMSPGFNPGTTGGVAVVAGTQIFYFWDTGTTWDRVDIGAISSADGNHTPISRGNATEDVAPTPGEVPFPESGDSASVYLTDGKLEYWVYTGSWTKAYVLQADQASNLSNGTVDATSYTIDNSNGTGVTLAIATDALAGLMSAADKGKLDLVTITQAVDLDELESDVADLTTLTGVASNNTDLGTFSGSTISDSQTIKAALQEVEIAHEALNSQVDANSNRRTSYVDLSSVTNIGLTGEQTIDGTLTSTSRVLVMGQTDTSENGVYVTAAGAWSRASDFNTASEFTQGRLVLVQGGTDRSQILFSNDNTVSVLDTDPISFSCIKTCVAADQDNEMEIVKDSDGIKIERQTLTAYATHALALAALSQGDAYILTANNQEGAVSDGVSGPVYWKTTA